MDESDDNEETQDYESCASVIPPSPDMTSVAEENLSAIPELRYSKFQACKESTVLSCRQSTSKDQLKISENSQFKKRKVLMSLSEENGKTSIASSWNA